MAVYARWAGGLGRSGGGPFARWASGLAAARGTVFARWADGRAAVIGGVLDPGLPQVWNAGETATVRGLVTTPGVVVDSWDFAVVWSNPKTPAVSFTELVNVATYQAPGTQQGTIGTWTITAHIAGYPDAVAVVQHAIRGHCVWQYGADGKYRPVYTAIAT